MKITTTSIEGLLLLTPEVFEDQRGHFFESFNKQELQNVGINTEFVQDNESYSKFGVLRALHFQARKPQAKLVRVVKGEVLDVAIDIRPDSPTFGQHASFRLSAENKNQLFIPRGFAHGFVTLSEDAVFQYKCDNYYDGNDKSGIIFDDPSLAIDWLLSKDQINVNDRDKSFPTLTEFKEKYLNGK